MFTGLQKHVNLPIPLFVWFVNLPRFSDDFETKMSYKYLIMIIKIHLMVYLLLITSKLPSKMGWKPNGAYLCAESEKPSYWVLTFLSTTGTSSSFVPIFIKHQEEISVTLHQSLPSYIFNPPKFVPESKTWLFLQLLHFTMDESAMITQI